MSLASIFNRTAAPAPRPVPSPTADRSRRDERSMRVVEGAIALLALGAAALLALAR